MLATALALSLSSIEPSHFAGALVEELADVPVEQLNREQLQGEYQRLDKAKPAIGNPIALAAVGGALIVVAGVVLWADFVVYVGTAFSTSTLALAGYILLVFGAALAVGGGVLLAVGLVKLYQRFGARRAVQQRMDDINARLESLDRANPPPQPELAPVVPATNFFAVPPSYVLARF
jgi:hypothetical protein